MSTQKIRLVKPVSSAHTVPDIGRGQLREIQKLLQNRNKPSKQDYQFARDTIDRIFHFPIEAPPPIDIADLILFLLASSISVKSLSGYATLDSYHIEGIDDTLAKIHKYTDDPSQRRPLNFLMLASSGAGKSHFIKCVADQLRYRKIKHISFNMATMQTSEDLISALDGARNLKVEDSFPLLFLDEFDSKFENIPLLLPLLWDGELTLGRRDLKLGRIIIVLAGSDPELPATMEHARNLRDSAPAIHRDTPKIVDLLSRINGGVLEIPPFFDPPRFDRRYDKVCIMMQLLRVRFGEALKFVPRALARFIYSTEFRYGVRSITHLIDLIPFKRDASRLRLSDLKLPLDSAGALKSSSLAYHLIHEEQVHGVVDLWKALQRDSVELPVFCNFETSITPWWGNSLIDKDAVVRAIARLRADLDSSRRKLS